MDAKGALADLAEISAQIIDAAILDETGGLSASLGADAATSAFGSAIRALLAEADRQASLLGQGELEALEVATASSGSVFVVRGASRRIIAATARPGAIAGLVLYDLRRCLERLEPDAGVTPVTSPETRRGPRRVADAAPPASETDAGA